jgi:two-component sensor histidine kinase
MTASIRVLLVDDNPDDRALVRREVEALFSGAEITEAGSREEFEQARRSRNFDLVVTDLHLNWGNGREVMMAIRQACPDAAVVMFTGTGDEMTAVELMKAGIDDYVVKHARQLPRLRASMKLAVDNSRQRSQLTERERQLSAALAHKDMIVRELHHRVKNNLQSIIDLLILRAHEKGGEVADELRDLAGRMRALAEVQARIYQADALDRVDFAAALAQTASELVKVYGNNRIQLVLDIERPFELEVAQAVPLALLCHETLLNSLKHAWPAGRSGTLWVELKKGNGKFELWIRDDGVGYTVGGGRGFGAKLAPALAREANAELSSESTPGQGSLTVIRLA